MSEKEYQRYKGIMSLQCYKNLLICWSERDVSMNFPSQIETVRVRLKKAEFKTPLSGPRIVATLHAENKLDISPELPHEVLLMVKENISADAADGSIKHRNVLAVARFMDTLGFLRLQLPKDIDSPFFVYHKEEWLKRYFPLLTKELLIEAHFIQIIDFMFQAGNFKKAQHQKISNLYHEKGWPYFKDLLDADQEVSMNKSKKRSDLQSKIWGIKHYFEQRKVDLFWQGLAAIFVLSLVHCAAQDPPAHPACTKLGLKTNWNLNQTAYCY